MSPLTTRTPRLFLKQRQIFTLVCILVSFFRANICSVAYFPASSAVFRIRTRTVHGMCYGLLRSTAVKQAQFQVNLALQIWRTWFLRVFSILDTLCQKQLQYFTSVVFYSVCVNVHKKYVLHRPKNCIIMMLIFLAWLLHGQCSVKKKCVGYIFRQLMLLL